MIEAGDLRALLARLFLRAAERIDGERLVGQRAGQGDAEMATASHVLAVGKVAFPMLRGLPAVGRARPTLAITTGALMPAAIPAGVIGLAADHPEPSARSVAAARAARAFVASVGAHPGDRLLVLLSGGASSLLCAPAPDLSLADKRAAIAAVARAGATIGELNTVRKHLSAIKGGRLALATRAPIAVRALSDVIGDDPATIGSGPFAADPSTFADALAVIGRMSAVVPAAARRRLEAGARGEVDETPKPGHPQLARVDHQILAGPQRAAREAWRAVEESGWRAGWLERDTERSVEALATLYLERLARAAESDGRSAPSGLILIGNGEPRVALPRVEEEDGTRPGRGGRSTHLALRMARELAALPATLRERVAFLAAGTDDRDGNSAVSGAAVDGTTWSRAVQRGLAPDAALAAYDSSTVLEAMGDSVRGPGTSNLLDLHLLAIGPPLSSGA